MCVVCVVVVVVSVVVAFVVSGVTTFPPRRGSAPAGAIVLCVLLIGGALTRGLGSLVVTRIVDHLNLIRNLLYPPRIEVRLFIKHAEG